MTIIVISYVPRKVYVPLHLVLWTVLPLPRLGVTERVFCAHALFRARRAYGLQGYVPPSPFLVRLTELLLPRRGVAVLCHCVSCCRAPRAVDRILDHNVKRGRPVLAMSVRLILPRRGSP